MRIFLDTEFIENGETIDLLSIALVADDGRELYAQIPTAKFEKASDWVARNVFPHLGHFDMGKHRRSCTVAKNGEFDRNDLKCADMACPWMRRHLLADAIVKFCGEAPEFWTYYGAYDWVALCQLFGDMSWLPKGWPMFAYDMRQWLNHQGLGVSQPDDAPHHALEDARWLARTYERYGPGIAALAEPQP
jgi:hypothetical protein